MNIYSIEKNTFIDYPKEIACTLFLQGCNFRCGYCHNPELMEVGSMGLKQEKILEFLENRKKYLTGVCFTGGEPLLTLDKEFLKKIKSMGYKIKLDTNGSFPEKLQELVRENLVDYVAMDIKCSREKYPALTNSSISLEKLEHCLRIISNMDNYEFRTTIIPGIHDKEEMKSIKQWLKESTGRKKLKQYSIQAFYPRERKHNDKRYENIKKPRQLFLRELKGIIEDLFENCEIKD